MGSTTITRDNLSALSPQVDGSYYRALPRAARSRKKWLWLEEPGFTGWLQRWRGRVTASNPTLVADGEDTVEVQVTLVDPQAHALEDIALAINGEEVTLAAGEVLELGPVTEVGQYQIQLRDRRVFGGPSEVTRTVLVVAGD